MIPDLDVMTEVYGASERIDVHLEKIPLILGSMAFGKRNPAATAMVAASRAYSIRSWPL
jgi:hypothetical protein